MPESDTPKNGATVVVAVIAFSEYVCFEVMLPPVGYLETAKLLAFELPRRVPAPVADLTVFFRRFPPAGGQCHVRVFAVKTLEWHRVLENLHDLKLDAVFHPFMVLPDTMVSPVYLPEFDPDYIWDKVEGQWSMLPKGNAKLKPVGNLHALIAKYALSPDFQRDKKHLSILPRELQLRHYRYWKIAVVILAMFTIISAIVLGYLYIIDHRNIAMAIRHEVDETDYRREYLRQALERGRPVSETASKILDGLNVIDSLSVMAQLTKVLPDTAWITNFRTGNGELAITLTASGNTDQINTALNQLPGFAMDSLRQQTNPDGSATFYVTLKQTGGTR